MNRRVAARAIVGILVSVVACLLVARSADVPEALGRVLAVDPRWLLLPVLVVALQLVVRATRWAALLTAVGPIPLGPRRTIGPLAVGYLGNTVLPARLGEVVRIVVLSRRTGVPATPATASVVLERVIDLLALLAIAATAAGVVGATGWLPAAATLLLLGAMAATMRVAPWIAERIPTVLPARVQDVLRRLAHAFAEARPPVIARAWGLSLVAWSFDALMVWLCAQALGIPIDFGTAVLIATGAAIGSAVPAGAGYIGTYELGAVTLAAWAGVPPVEALQIAVLAHAIAVLPLALAGLAALVLGAVPIARRVRPAPAAADVPASLTAGQRRPG